MQHCKSKPCNYAGAGAGVLMLLYTREDPGIDYSLLSDKYWHQCNFKQQQNLQPAVKTLISIYKHFLRESEKNQIHQHHSCLMSVFHSCMG